MCSTGKLRILVRMDAHLHVDSHTVTAPSQAPKLKRPKSMSLSATHQRDPGQHSLPRSLCREGCALHHPPSSSWKGTQSSHSNDLPPKRLQTQNHRALYAWHTSPPSREVPLRIGVVNDSAEMASLVQGARASAVVLVPVPQTRKCQNAQHVVALPRTPDPRPALARLTCLMLD